MRANSRLILHEDIPDRPRALVPSKVKPLPGRRLVIEDKSRELIGLFVNRRGGGGHTRSDDDAHSSVE